MRISDMFQKPIDRDIKGVIKVGQTDEENVFQELEEYVVTKQLARHFRDFFDAYQQSLHRPTDNMGVWISGFFGSGKSHFLKILAYLLENKEVEGKKAIDFFQDKIDDPIVYANMRQAGQASCDVILFNIDSKSNYDVKNTKEALIKVFVKVFYEMQGYYGDKPWIADMESALDQEGVYEKFKAEIKELTGEEWEKRRRRVLLDRDNVITALQRARNMSYESALEWFNAKDDNFDLSIERFAQIVKEYLDSKGPDHRIVFLVDEMGQYIGDNNNMMLNLQTIVEELGVHCHGRAWVLVTSQEDLDSIIKGLGTSKENDFSKIQGRFHTRLNLTSANVDEVIKRRILEKKEAVAESLRLYYDQKSAVLRNLMTFAPGTPEMKSYADRNDFAEVYPFVPYQFNLLQKVFTGIREHASSGRHLASGERSLLSAFQEALLMHANADLGVLVPFQDFYESIKSFLDSSVSQVIEQAESNSQLKEEDIGVLKLLFMIKYVKEMPAKIDNLTTLMVSHVEEDKLALRDRILASLRRLEEQTLIHKNGDEYEFLTNEEQEVNREIKRIEVDDHELCRKIGDIIFEEIYPARRYRHDNRYDFSFNQMIDDKPRGPQDGEISLQIVTPIAGAAYDSQHYRTLSSLNHTHIYIVLPDDREFIDEIEGALKIETYRRRSSSTRLAQNVLSIINSKVSELGTRYDRARSLLAAAIGEAEVYARGERLDIRTKNPKDKIDQALKGLVEILYRNLHYVQEFTSSVDELRYMLADRKNRTSLQEDELNKQALEAVKAFIDRRDYLNQRVTMKDILDQFRRSPYGWNDLDIAAIVARLFIRQEIRLQYGGDDLTPSDPAIPDYLTKRNEVERLVIRKRIGVAPELIHSVRSIGQQVFHQASFSLDEDELMNQLKAQIASQLSQAERLSERYQDGRSSKYPGQDVVTQSRTFFAELLRLREPALFFAEIEKERTTLEHFVRQLDMVRGFFDTQKAAFDEGLRVMEIFEENKSFVSAEEVLGPVERIREIIESPSPYGEIHRLPVLRDEFNKAFLALLEKACEPIEKEIRADYDLILEALAKHDFDEAFQEKVKAPFERLLREIQTVNSFLKAYAMEKESQNHRNKAWHLIELELAKAKGNSEGYSVEPQQPDRVFERRQVSARELFRGQVVLRSDEDIEALLSRLRDRLTKMRRGNEEIEIIW